MKSLIAYGLLIVVAVVVTGLLGSWIGADLTFKVPPSGQSMVSVFWERMQIMFIISVLIERSVEVYLKATGQDGTETYNPNSNTLEKLKDASRPAMLAAMFISLLVAICGVRIVNTFATLPTSPDPLQSVVWHGVDIFVSAGLMAGGADLFHKLAEVIVGGLDSARRWAGGQTPGSQVPRTVVPQGPEMG